MYAYSKLRHEICKHSRPQMFKYLGVFCVCFLLSGARGDFLDDLKHFGDQALHSALDTLSSDGVKTLVSSAVSAAGTGQ